MNLHQRCFGQLRRALWRVVLRTACCVTSYRLKTGTCVTASLSLLVCLQSSVTKLLGTKDQGFGDTVIFQFVTCGNFC